MLAMERTMHRNLARALAISVGALAVAAVPNEGHAVSLNLINTWRMGDMGPVYNTVGPAGSYAGTGPAWGYGAYPRLGVNLHFGVGFGKGDQVVPYIGIGLHRVSYNRDYVPNDDDGDQDLGTDTGAALQFGFDIGAKFFFIERAKGKAPPFINVAFYKYVGNIVEDGGDGILVSYDGAPPGHGDGDADVDNAGDYQYYDQDLLSPTGFKFAFGAEYYFNDNFALGGEFFGIDFSWVQAVNPEDIDLQDTRTQFSLYTALHLTYRFSFSVRASVQFESDYDYED
jgi:hypothetical protein